MGQGEGSRDKKFTRKLITTMSSCQPFFFVANVAESMTYWL